ncbi:1,4-alpha-glucan branching enzyme [Silvibacterium bohemicum]|uniref:1,4-alpha-glucan branching enzyme n=2 Tax=Silvibacterium bohemicum TaxID=1577686 RepID=A0A841K1X4_9BACT|nr:1,4-alpha-glucan branching enzyme [Silvibacterium bohemicum]
MIDLSEVGAFPAVTGANQFSVRFGIYLPGIHSSDQFEVIARVIHSEDRFDPSIPPVNFSLAWQSGHPLDLWTVTVPLTPVAGTHIGLAGMHLYRYELWWTPVGGTRQLVSPWITDPFARDAEIGNMAAFDVGPAPAPFAWADNAYKTPELDDLIVYELQVEEFNDTFDGVTDRLVYLKSLGVNCVELMPVTSMKLDFDWGYGPLYYFAPSMRFGGSVALKRLINAAHEQEMAVILDVVYEHVDTLFPYYCVYNDLANTTGAPKVANPMMDGWNIYGFGPKPDFTIAFTQDYFLNANQQWIDEYHVDGFRYDEVTDLYVPPMDAGYRTLVEQTYLHSLTVPRFQGGAGGYSRIIQCAEALDSAQTVLAQTYTNSAWQNGLLYLAEAIASGTPPADSYAHQLDPSFMGYPATTEAVDAAGNAIQMPVAPFQYLESHDHSQLIVYVGTGGDANDPTPEGDRSLFFKLQPHAIALYTLQGIPMLWQGQEFADNYNLPDSGLSRVHLQRDMHWEYFYDSYGSPLVSLYRRLGSLRRSVRALRSRSSYYYWQQSLQGTEVIIYSRHAAASGTDAESWALVLLNFGGTASTGAAPFPVAGTWREMVDDSFRATPYEVAPVTDGGSVSVTVPSNYGQVWVKVA